MAPKRELSDTKDPPAKRTHLNTQGPGTTVAIPTANLPHLAQLPAALLPLPSQMSTPTSSLPGLTTLRHSISEMDISRTPQPAPPLSNTIDVSSSSTTPDTTLQSPHSQPVNPTELDTTQSTSDESDISDLPDNPPTANIATCLPAEPSSPSTPIQGPQEHANAKTEKKQSTTSSAGNTTKVTVASVIPRPTKCLINPDHVSGCSDELLRRINALSQYVNVSGKTYALAHIPPNATWGVYDPYDDRSKDLCIPTTNDRFHIWMVGRITSVWFVKNGVPENQCSVTVQPLSNSLGLQANQLIAGLSSPPLLMTSLTPGVIRASRWQTPKSGTDGILFNCVYDARKVLLAKNAMEKYDTLQLKKRDLVLLETRIIRYRLKDENNRYTMHHAQFELQAISILQSDPNTFTSFNDNSDIDIDDLHI